MFDPYHKWLGIPKKYRPPTYYRLLGIEPDETDREVIDEAAIRQSAHLRTYQIGEHADLCTRLLNEISQARTVLLDPAKRKKYDAQLAQRAAANQRAGIQTPAPTRATHSATAPSPFSDLGSGRADAKKRPAGAHEGQYRKKRPNYLLLGLAAGAALLVLFIAVPVCLIGFFVIRSNSSGVDLKNDPIAFVKPEDKPKKNPNPILNPNPKPVENPNPVNPKPKPVDPKPKPVKPKPKQPGNETLDVTINPKPANQKPEGDLPNAKEIFSLSTGGPVGDIQLSNDKGQVIIANANLAKYNRTTKKIAKTHRLPRSDGSGLNSFLQLTQDGKLLFSVHNGGDILIWDTATDREIGRLQGHEFGVKGIALLPNGRQLVSIGKNTLRLWDVESRKEIFRTAPVSHNRSLALSPDGKRALVLKDIGPSIIEVWDMENKRMVRRMNFSRNWSLSKVAFAANGIYAATYSNSSDRRRGVLFGKTDSDTARCAPVEHRLTSLAISPDGKYAVASGWDKVFSAWDVQTCQPACLFVGHTRNISGVRFAPDGKHVISGAGDGCVKIWELPKLDVATAPMRPVLKRYQLERHLESIRLLPMSNFLVLGGSKVQLWQPGGGEPFVLAPRKNGSVHATIGVSPDGTMAATSVMGDKDISLWDVRNRKLLGMLQGHTETASRVVFLPDGKTLASAGYDKTVRLWDVRNLRELYKFDGPTHRLEGLAVSPDGRRLVAAASNGIVYVWDLGSRLPIRKVNLYKNTFPFALAFTPDGKRLVCGGCRGIFSLENGTFRVLHTIPVKKTFVNSFSISPDGKRGVSTCSGKDAKVWNMQSMRLLHTLTHKATVTDAVFAPDNQTIYSCARDNLYVWKMP